MIVIPSYFSSTFSFCADATHIVLFFSLRSFSFVLMVITRPLLSFFISCFFLSVYDVSLISWNYNCHIFFNSSVSPPSLDLHLVLSSFKLDHYSSSLTYERFFMLFVVILFCCCSSQSFLSTVFWEEAFFIELRFFL